MNRNKRRRWLSKLLSYFGPRERFGPHIIQPTGEYREFNDVDNNWRTEKLWQCKYCDWEGIHPEKSSVNIGLRRDCNDIEWIDSEEKEFIDTYEQ